MDAATKVVKNAISIPKILGWLILALVVFAVLDVAGFTSWILYPVTAFKAKFLSKGTGTGSNSAGA